jgi:lysozyme family protein
MERDNNLLFEECMVIILKHEGGYVNDPDDLGGETNYGIAKRYFPDEDIKNMTIDRAKEIYYEKYWTPMRLDEVCNKHYVLELLDMGVNSGPINAIKLAQRILNVVVDGIIGPKTLFELNNYLGDFVKEYKEQRIEYYKSIVERRPLNAKFLKGWLRRVETTKFK